MEIALNRYQDSESVSWTSTNIYWHWVAFHSYWSKHYRLWKSNDGLLCRESQSYKTMMLWDYCPLF